MEGRTININTELLGGTCSNLQGEVLPLTGCGGWGGRERTGQRGGEVGRETGCGEMLGIGPTDGKG